MEAVGLLASAAQISAYVFSIVSAVREARTQIRKAPSQLQDKAEQLLFLQSIVDTIKANERLHTDRIGNYLARIEDKISRLHRAVLRSLEDLKAKSYRKIWSAFAVVKAQKQIQETFADLDQDKSNLHFHVTSVCGASLLSDKEARSRTDEVGEMSFPQSNVSSWTKLPSGANITDL